MNQMLEYIISSLGLLYVVALFGLAIAVFQITCESSPSTWECLIRGSPRDTT